MQFSLMTETYLLSTRYYVFFGVGFLSLLSFSIGFIVNNVFIQSLFKHNIISLFSFFDISYECKFGAHLLKREILVCISSLTSCLSPNSILKINKQFITPFLLFLFNMLDNYLSKTELDDIRLFHLI